MSRHKKRHHSVGLGSSFLNRARFVFLFSFLSVILILGLAIYNSNKTGALRKNVIEPIKKAAISFVENINEEPTIPIPTPFLDQSSNTNIIINSKTITPTPVEDSTNSYYESGYQSYYQSTYQNSYTPSKSFEEIVAENNRWAEEKRAENEKWFQEKSAESRAKYNAAVEQMNAEYQANVQKAKEEQEAWKKEHGF